MKIFILLIVLFPAVTFSQSILPGEKKQINTAEDVIQNYVNVTGGWFDRLDTVKSIYFNGSFTKDKKIYSFHCFISKDKFYYTIDDKKIDPLKEFGRKNMQNFNLILLENSGLLVESGYLFYLSYKLFDVTAKLDGEKYMNGKATYKIDFTKENKFIKTAYFDKDKFYKIKTVNRDNDQNKFEINFSDFKEIKNTGIFFPHKIESVFNFQINEYRLNEEPNIQW